MPKSAAKSAASPGLSAYEQQRLAQINANREVLEQLGLLDDAKALRQTANKPASSKKTHASGDKKRKALAAPSRESSGRAEALMKQAEEEAREAAARRANEEAAAEERREEAKARRKEREVMARREAALLARKKAKLEEERKVRQREQDRLRRERDAEMRKLREERADALRKHKAEMRRIAAEEAAEEARKRDGAFAEAEEAMRERKGALRRHGAASVDDAVAEVAARRSAREGSASRAAARKSHQEAVVRQARQGRSSGGSRCEDDFFELYEGFCDFPGCTHKLHHLGPHSCEAVEVGKRRRSSCGVSYRDQSEAELVREFDLKVRPREPWGANCTCPLAPRRMNNRACPFASPMAPFKNILR